MGSLTQQDQGSQFTFGCGKSRYGRLVDSTQDMFGIVYRNVFVHTLVVRGVWCFSPSGWYITLRLAGHHSLPPFLILVVYSF